MRSARDSAAHDGGVRPHGGARGKNAGLSHREQPLSSFFLLESLPVSVCLDSALDCSCLPSPTQPPLRAFLAEVLVWEILVSDSSAWLALRWLSVL